MVQAARISITGTQTMEDGGPQTLELVTDGSYCYEPGFALLSYVESEMTGLEGVVTSFQIEDGKTVTLRRSGKVNAEMVFDRSPRNRASRKTSARFLCFLAFSSRSWYNIAIQILSGLAAFRA